MLRSLGTVGVLAATLITSPAPKQADVMNFRFNAHEAGCLTRGIKALDNDNSIVVKPDPQHPGKGMILSINRKGFQALISELAATNRTCIEQAIYLLTPDDQTTPSSKKAYEQSQKQGGGWRIPFDFRF